MSSIKKLEEFCRNSLENKILVQDTRAVEPTDSEKESPKD